MRALVTGGAGFIGSNLVRHLMRERPSWEVINFDLLTYAGNLDNLTEVSERPGYRFVRGDVADPAAVEAVLDGVDVVFHLAAESHVDRSIDASGAFVRTNVVGTQVLLDAARASGVDRFVLVSTDEVYGELPWQDPADEGPRLRFQVDTPLDPRSPYAATKAAADLIALAYHRTHGMDVVITRCSNNYGPFQFPEKLIPLMVTNGLEGLPLPLYGDGLNVRDWIHVADHCRGLLAACEAGVAGAVYNFGGDAERTNRAVVEQIVGQLGLDESVIQLVKDRPGHDRRYAVDWNTSQQALGWRPEKAFEEGLQETVMWYRTNPQWWRRVKSGEYRTYFDGLYGAGGRHATR